MNRILQADVILTLTAEQAQRLLALLRLADRGIGSSEPALRIVVLEQCEKQGVWS